MRTYRRCWKRARGKVLIVQNDVGNHFSTTVIVVAITAKHTKANIPTHIEIKRPPGFERDSVVLLEQLRTIDKSDIRGSED